MTAPADFAELFWDDDGGQNHERREEQWDEPRQECSCCGLPADYLEDGVCLECWEEED